MSPSLFKRRVGMSSLLFTRTLSNLSLTKRLCENYKNCGSRRLQACEIRLKTQPEGCGYRRDIEFSHNLLQRERLVFNNKFYPHSLLKTICKSFSHIFENFFCCKRISSNSSINFKNKRITSAVQSNVNIKRSFQF